MDELYMARCLELAGKGLGTTAPNPMVGCVIVQGDRIIGEGYHHAFGESHAEVNAINSVGDPGLLAHSTLYVNLEPCSHFGKTPPCSHLIAEKGIPEVVIGTTDPNPRVAGSGLRDLEGRGVRVKNGVLAEECEGLNRRFFTFHREKRPWILLKWAQTSDGFIDRDRSAQKSEGVNWISGETARQWVHKWRSEEQAVLVGTNTALVDDPELTVRHWEGRDPVRLVIDREGRLPHTLRLFNNEADTWVFTSKPGKDSKRVSYVEVPQQKDYIPFILDYLHGHEIQSLLVEGGAALLNSFIKSGSWDEARVFTGRIKFGVGLPSPEISGDPAETTGIDRDVLEIYRNPTA